MTDLDTLRWGDTQSVQFNEVNQPDQPGNTTQLVHCHWSRPITWRLLLNIQPSVPAGELGTFVAIGRVTLGTGAGVSTLSLPDGGFVFTPAQGYNAITAFFDLPAQDIQVQFALNFSGATSPAEHSFLFSAYCAPLTEPAGYTEIRDLMLSLLDRERPPSPDSAGLPHWMPPGFDDGELRYRGGR